MNKNKAILSFGILLTVLLLTFGVFKAGMAVGAATNEPGSAGDPLVTQSYLEKRIKENTGKSESVDSAANAGTSYKKVTVDSGKTIMGSAGTEFIIYSGSGTITGTSGVINLTSGEKFSSGNTAVKYSIYLVPDNNCGIRVTSKSVIFAKGNYKIN